MGETTFEGLARSSPRELEAVLRSGVAPDPQALAGSEWRGFNVGFKMRLLGSQKFLKGFFSTGPGVFEGYNVPARQNGLDGAWVPKPSADSPKRFGFFVVKTVVAGGPDGRHPNALLLDYGASTRNPRWSPTRPIRDYLVQPDPANPNLLLGKGSMAAGRARLGTQFFVLERADSRPAWTP